MTPAECYGRGGGYVARWIHAERDATNVELLLALSQAAPLLILNLFVMARTLPTQTRQGHFSQTREYSHPSNAHTTQCL